MEISSELADRVMRLVVSPQYRPCKPKQIAAQLGLDLDGYREVRRVVKQLVLEGRLFYGSNHLVMSTGAVGGPGDRLRGTFRRAMGGDFGFVRPNHSGDAGGDDNEDVFIPPGKTGGALEGDLVEVSVKPSRKGGNEGVVRDIVQRARRQFTGTLHFDGGRALVYLDGTHHEQPVSIGDVRGIALQNDDKVFVEVVEFPDESGQELGQAVLLERLGASKNPNIDTLLIMRQFALPDSFSEDVIHDARVQADAFDDSIVPEGRRDLSELLTITIDPFDARDFDDAISLVREDGRWRLWVHIADVTHFVPSGGPLDEEAKRRATSVYLPGRVVPMIPEIISNHLASLQPEQRRFTKTVEIEIQDDLTITHVEVFNAVIRSDQRFNYEQIDRFLEKPEAFDDSWSDEIRDLIRHMHTLAMQLRKQRFGSGALSMDMPDIKLQLDRNGKVKGADKQIHTESHQIIEEFMLAANREVATWLDDAQYNFLHRNHAPPDRRKIRQLTVFAKDLGLATESMESRFEIQRILDKVAGTPLEDAVNFAVLKSMSKAVYSPEQEGHYALDFRNYCHFTSPIRRYPDLTVHRLVQRILDGEKTPDESLGMLVQLGQHCSDMERNAAQAERELVLLKLLHFLGKHIGETMEAVISRVFADGIHARSLKLPVDGFIPVSTLPSDSYRFERRGQVLTGFRDGNRFRLGDKLSVKIDRVDMQDRQLYFRVIKNHSVGKSSGMRGKPERTGGKSVRKSNSSGRGKKRSGDAKGGKKRHRRS